MAERRTDKNSGFTLVEILITIVLVSLISIVIVNVFSVIVRTTPQAQNRADDARSLLGLSTWLPSDLSSTPHVTCSDAPACTAAAPSWDRAPGTASGCAGADEGINILRLAWTESFGTVATTSTFVANYRFVTRGGSWKIQRVACTLGGPRSSLRLSSDLPPPANPATWAAGTAPIWITWKVDADNLLVGASFEVQTLAGDNVRIDGSSNNVNATLPPLASVITEPPTTPPTTPPSTTTATTTATTTPTGSTTATTTPTGSTTATTTAPTTTTTTTTPPPTTTIPCTATIVSVSPSPAKNQQKPGTGNNIVNGPLYEQVAVTIAKNGSCGDLGLEYYPQSSAKQWKPFGNTLQVILPAVALEPWSDGTHVLQLRNGQLGNTVGAAVNLSVT